MTDKVIKVIEISYFLCERRQITMNTDLEQSVKQFIECKNNIEKNIVLEYDFNLCISFSSVGKDLLPGLQWFWHQGQLVFHPFEVRQRKNSWNF